jgi:cytoskeletal protein CcmA (bactofilin family)
MDQPKDSDKANADKPAPEASADAGKSTSEKTAEAFNKPSELDTKLPEGADKPLSNTSDIADLPKNGPGGQKSHFKISDITHNIYILIFIVIFAAGGGLTVYSMMTAKKTAPLATIGSTDLSQTALNQLAVSSANLGASAETLTVQSNAIFDGQLLTKGNLTVAGTLQTGGAIQTPSITVSGTTNTSTLQTQTLQVANNETVAGTSNIASLTVDGTSTFSGAITASQISVAKLIISNGGSLTVPNHISFPGASPSKVSNSSVLGDAGSASINGSDTSGTVNINTGTGPTTGCFVQVTFNQAYSSAPRVLLTPVGAPSGLLQYYVTITSTGFSVCTDNTPAADTVYAFDYFVMGED